MRPAVRLSGGRRAGESASVDTARDAELGAGAAFLALDDVDVEERRERRARRPSRRARIAGHTRAASRSASSSVLAERDQPGQSSAEAKTFSPCPRGRPRGDPIGLGSRGEGSAGLPERAHELGEGCHVPAVGTERVNKRRGDDHAVCAGLGERSNVRRPADAEPDGDRDGRGGA